MLEYKVIEKINEGMSKDSKYIVELTKDNKKCLLRVSNFSQKKVDTYEVIKKIYYSSDSSKLIDYFIQEDKIYAFFEYIDGYVLNDILHKSSNDEKYNYGFQAGRTLSLLHENKNLEIENLITNLDMVKYILNQYNLFPMKNKVIDKVYDFCISIKDDINFNNYCFLNADFHSKNMVVNVKKLYLIDLEKYEYGDQVRDLTFIYTFDEDRNYSNGILNGYFSNYEISKDFWIRFKFFSALSIIQYYMWNLNKFKKEFNSIDIAYKFFDEYEKNSIVPKWFKKNGE